MTKKTDNKTVKRTKVLKRLFYFFVLFAGISTFVLINPQNAKAAIAFDAASESHTGTTASTNQASFSWTHSPVVAPEGIVVFVITLNSATAYDTSVTYGGSSMTRDTSATATDSAGEPGVVRTYFLGSSVPTGNQTVTVNRTNNSVEMYAVAFSVNSTNTYNTEIYTAGIVLVQDDGAWSEQNVTDGSPGTNSLRFVGVYDGTNNVPSAGSSSTAGPSIDVGVYTSATAYETTAGQGSRPVGFSQGGNDDRAGVHLAVREVVPTITLSGNIYQTNESSAYLCSTSGNLTINLRVDGAGSYTTTCTADTGAWSISTINASSGQTVYVYVDGGSVFGTTVLVSDGTNQSNLNIFQNRVILRDDANGSITNTEISTGDTADTDDLITFPSSVYTVGAAYETHIYGGDTWAPGANSSTGFLHIDTGATFSAGSNTLTLTATSGTLLVRDGTFTQATGTVTVTPASGTPTLLSAATTFHILTINSSATVINDGAAVTINNASGAALTVTSGVLNLSTTPTGPGSGNGTLTVSSGATLCLGGSASNTSATCDSVNTATTTVTMPTFQTYSFNSTGTVRYLSDANTTIDNTPSYGNLIFNPKFDTTSRTYTLAGAMTINGDFTVNPDETGAGSPALTINLGGTVTVAATKTTTIQASNSATSSLDINPGTSYNLSSGLLVVGAGGTLDGTGATSTITLTATAGTLFTRSGTFTAGSTTVEVTSASGAPTFNSGTFLSTNSFYNLTINPSSITIATSADDITVTNTLNIGSGDTFSLPSGQDLTHSGNTLTLDGTISGSGTYIYQSATALPTTGTISAVLRMDATNNDQSIAGTGGGRTITGNVEIYNNSGASARNIVLGSASSQIINFSGNVVLNAANTQGVNLTASANNPTINITGDLDSTSGGGNEDITTGTGIWTVSGNVDFTDVNSFTSTGGTFQMNGSGKNLTSAGETFNNFIAAGGSITTSDATTIGGNFDISGSGSFTHNSGNMTISGTFDVTSGTFAHGTGGSGSNLDIYIAGDFTLANGITWTENTDVTSQVIFNGDLDYADNNGTKKSIGNVVIGTSPETINLTTDYASNSLTVNTGDFFNTCEYEVDIGNNDLVINGTFDTSATGQGVSPCSAGNEADETTINVASTFTISAAGSFAQDASTLIMDNPSGTDTITLDGESLYNLTVSPGGTSQFADTADIDNNLLITTGTLDLNGQTVTIGGNFDNDAAMTHNSASVTFNAASGTKTIDADGTGSEAFYDVTFSDGASGPTYQLTTLLDVNNDLTISGGDLDANGQAISVQGSWNNSGGTFTANGNTVTFDDTDGGETLAGTMTGSSGFYNITFDDNGNSGAWNFNTNSATVTNNFIITGGSVTAPSTTLTISQNFTNDDSFSNNSGSIVFNDSGKTSELSYSATTTFNDFTVSTAGKQMKFDDTDGVVTDIDGTLTLQGTNCTSGRIFLDPITASQNWDIAASGSVDIDYIDVEYSTASPGLTADNSTEDNSNNSGWTINGGACQAHEVNIRGDSVIKGGVRIK